MAVYPPKRSMGAWAGAQGCRALGPSLVHVLLAIGLVAAGPGQTWRYRGGDLLVLAAMSRREDLGTRS
jgi:hypothetical protein